MAKSSKWNDSFYLRAYLYARSGITDSAIAKLFGVTASQINGWIGKKPAFREALEMGRDLKSSGSFREYIHGRLSPEMRELWDRINMAENVQNGTQRIEEMLANSGKTARQHLFLYSLVHCNFNQSEACRKVNIPVTTLHGWISNEPDFAKLIDEIHWHKGNFFEEALVKQIKAGDPVATIFVNKTFNKDRGYGDSLKIDVNKKVTHEHTVEHRVVIDVERMPIELKRQMIAYLREQKELAEKSQIADKSANPTIIDV